MTRDEYTAMRAKTVADWQAKIAADLDAIMTAPETFTISDAIGLVGVDKALELHLAGKLKPSA